MEPDTNSAGHYCWFHFMTSHTKKGETVRFRVLNFTKEHLNIDRVCSFSAKTDRKDAKGWQKNIPVKWYFQNNSEINVGEL